MTGHDPATTPVDGFFVQGQHWTTHSLRRSREAAINEFLVRSADPFDGNPFSIAQTCGTLPINHLWETDPKNPVNCFRALSTF
jgi:hypothetical protein